MTTSHHTAWNRLTAVNTQRSRLAMAIIAIAWLPLVFTASAQATLVNSIGGAENWFRADKEVDTTGSAVDQWNDQSGNNDDATPIGAGDPTLVSSVFNGLPAIRFTNSTTTDDLSFTGVSHGSGNDLSFFAVVQPGSGFDIGDNIGFFLGSTAGGANDTTKIGPWSTGGFFFRRIGNGAGTNEGTWPNPDLDPPEAHIVYLQRNTSNSMTSGFDGATPGDAATVANTSQINRIGGPTNSDTTQNFPGDIAELVFFGDALNTAERVLMENYLSSKYDLSLSGTGSQDIYAGDTPGNFDFDFDLFGVGRDDSGAGGSLSMSNSGAAELEITSGLDDGDFIAAGFQLNDDSSQSLIYLDETDLEGNEEVTLSYDLTLLGIVPGSIRGLDLLFDADNPNALAQIGVNGTLDGNFARFSLNGVLQDGFYSFNAIPIPEPSSLLLLGLGCFGLLMHQRRRKTSTCVDPNAKSLSTDTSNLRTLRREPVASLGSHRMKIGMGFIVCIGVAMMLSGRPAHAALLSIDFQNSGNVSIAPATETGFQAFTEADAGGKTFSSSLGDITVSVSGQDTTVDGFFNRGGVSDGGLLTYDDLYNDFAFHNSANQTIAITLSGPGIKVGTTYEIGVYAFDSNAGGTVVIAAGTDTTGTGGSIVYSTLPTTNDQYRFTSIFETTSGTLEILASSVVATDLRVNGFEILSFTTPPPIPEPSTILLFGLGVSVVVVRNRRRRHRRCHADQT